MARKKASPPASRSTMAKRRSGATPRTSAATAKNTASKRAASRTATKKPTGRRGFPLGRTPLLLLLLAFVVVAGLGWYWQNTVRLAHVEFDGVEHADEAELRRLLALGGEGMGDEESLVDTTLYDLDPATLADRVARHPWVRAASVSRRPTGTLAFDVEEREPVALVVAQDGTPGFFLDAEGFRMPRVPTAIYPVPLLRGALEPYEPLAPVESATLRELLAALASLDERTDALVSEIELGKTGRYTLFTTPVSNHPSLPVELGREGFAARLRTLRAFYDQAILPQPAVTFERINLSFDGQVVTEEYAAENG